MRTYYYYYYYTFNIELLLYTHSRLTYGMVIETRRTGSNVFGIFISLLLLLLFLLLYFVLISRSLIHICI
jgi:hypothetical protein